jgi:hypothetical protein
MKNLFIGATLFCNYQCFLSEVNLRNLKEAACQITYKTLYEDLKNKATTHYKMPSLERTTYETIIKQWAHDCLPTQIKVNQL